jgi:hypothetical protein
MKKQRLNTDEAFLSIVGKNHANKAQNPSNPPPQAKTEVVAPPIPEEKPQAKPQTTPQTKQLVQTAFYITKEHQKALKMKIALSDGGEDKDQSAIVRCALDAYLSDILQKK